MQWTLGGGIIERDVIVDSLPEKGSKYQIRLRDDPIYGIVPEGLNWKVIHNVQSGMQMLRESRYECIHFEIKSSKRSLTTILV